MRVIVCPLCTSSKITKVPNTLQTTVGVIECYKCNNEQCPSKAVTGYLIAVLFIPEIEKVRVQREPI